MSKGSMHLKCFLSITGGQGIDLVKNASKRQISAFLLSFVCQTI